MNTEKQLHKGVSAHFEGQYLERLRWAWVELTHSWIEFCKWPFMPNEKVADIGKYILGIGIPVILIVLLEWACSGSFL